MGAMIRSLAYSPNGLELAIATESAIFLWDLRSDEPGVELDRRQNMVHCIAYSPCGTWILTGGSDTTIRLWRYQAGEIDRWFFVFAMGGRTEAVLCLAWNPVVPLEFVTGCKDGSVRVWRITICDDGEGVSVGLVWGSGVGRLCVSDVQFKSATGLSPIYQKLLVQRGAHDPLSSEGNGSSDEVPEFSIGDYLGEGFDGSSEEGDDSTGYATAGESFDHLHFPFTRVMDTHDYISLQENTPPVPSLNEHDVASKQDRLVNGANTPQQQTSVSKEIVAIDEENAFSFRKKKKPSAPTSQPVRSSPRRSTLLTSPLHGNSSNNPLLTSPSARPMRVKSAVKEELSLDLGRSVTFAPGTLTPDSRSPFSTPRKNTGSSSSTLASQEETAPSQRWDAIWKCSWIVPALVPVSNTVASNTSATTSRRSTYGFPQRRSVSLNNKEAVFEGKGGVKVQGTVTELPGIVFALPTASTSHPSLNDASLQDQVRKENIEMHLVARIRICTFPIFLLAPGCVEPCRIFTSPDSKTSAQFLTEMLNDEDIAYMKEQLAAGVETAMGSIGLLLRVAPKQGQIGKKKAMSTNSLRQEINPFMMPVALGPLGDNAKTDPVPTEENTGSQRKLFQETSMFLVYGALVKDKQPTNRHAEPVVSFFAYPLVDQASLMDHILLNSRSLDQMKQRIEKAEVEPKRTGALEDFVSYDDPMVDSIMNGCDSEQESGYSSDRASRKNMDVDEDDSLQEEMELLRAIERNRSWAPYVVTSTTLPPPLGVSHSTASSSSTTNMGAYPINHSMSGNLQQTSKDVKKERSLSRAQTMGDVGMSSRKEGPSRSTSSSSNAFSRHRSMDGRASVRNEGGLTSALVGASTSSNAGMKHVRKGISRIKSPSRAPQKPLDVTTEGLRRKLLGPGSIKKTLTSTTTTTNGEADGSRRSSFSSMHFGMKSPSRRAAASSANRGSSSPAVGDDIPDLMTMMKMKKQQNIERAALAAASAGNGRREEGDDGGDPFSAPSPMRVQPNKGDSERGSSSSGSSRSLAAQSSPFLVTLKNIQSEEQQVMAPKQEQRSDDRRNIFDAKPVKAPSLTTVPVSQSSHASSSSSTSGHARSQPPPLPTASSLVSSASTSASTKSIESRNQATIKGLTVSVLSKNNIGPGHEEFEECAEHLYRTVTFAMRKDIGTKVYHLEELERLMDRHASMI
ncbi:hypothetical protein BGW39_008315 [Mortierella sp. 14UC]|nr:hypothetical protein BGW39_008315 [Mortierella sp. 14UC]